MGEKDFRCASHLQTIIAIDGELTPVSLPPVYSVKKGEPLLPNPENISHYIPCPDEESYVGSVMTQHKIVIDPTTLQPIFRRDLQTRSTDPALPSNISQFPGSKLRPA